MHAPDLEVAVEAAEAAAAVIRSSFGAGVSTAWKGAVDPVTEVDRRAEDRVLDVIRSHRPDDRMLAEETGGADWSGGRVWIVDPLDGTVNFVHGLPHVAVSVGLWVDGRAEVGVVVDVMADILYSAARGEGAAMSGSEARISTTEHLGESLVATGFPYDRQQRADHYARVLARVLARSRGLRRLGSAALDLCWVAAGRFDAYWEEGLQPWDAAAGALIVTEAGGRVTAPDGSEHRLDGPGIVASNGRIHDELIDVLGGVW